MYTCVYACAHIGIHAGGGQRTLSAFMSQVSSYSSFISEIRLSLAGAHLVDSAGCAARPGVLLPLWSWGSGLTVVYYYTCHFF